MASNSEQRGIYKEIIVCVIWDKNAESLLLIDHNYNDDPAAFWFPYSQVAQNESTLDTAKRVLLTLKSSQNFEPSNLLKIYSTHLMPVFSENAFKIVYLLFNSIQNTQLEEKESKWMNSTQLKISQRKYELMGLEPVLILKQLTETKNSTNINVNNFLFEPKMTYVDSINAQCLTEQLVISAKFNRTIQELLYAIYFSYSFPSEYLGLSKFKIFLQKLEEVNKSFFEMAARYRNLFHSFDLSQKYLLSFNDFLFGMAALEPNTQHGGTPAEQRCRYIFRYYAFDSTDENFQNTTMNIHQFKELVYDINIMKKTSSLDEASLEIETINGFKQFGINRSTDSLSLSDFLVGVGQLKFRGTSVLFRLNKSIVDLIELSNDSLIYYSSFAINKLTKGMKFI